MTIPVPRESILLPRRPSAPEQFQQFAQLVGLDSRNALTVLYVTLDRLARDARRDLDLRSTRLAESARRSAGHIGELIELLVEEPRLVDLNQEARHAVAQLRETKSSQLVMRIDPLPAIHGRGKALRRLFRNLFANMLAVREGDGRLFVAVDARYSDGAWDFSVFGKGKLAPSRQWSRPFGGMPGDGAIAESGVDLSLCQQVIAMHAGKIWLDSLTDSELVFRFRIPELRTLV